CVVMITHARQEGGRGGFGGRRRRCRGRRSRGFFGHRVVTGIEHQARQNDRECCTHRQPSRFDNYPPASRKRQRTSWTCPPREDRSTPSPAGTSICELWTRNHPVHVVGQVAQPEGGSIV